MSWVKIGAGGARSVCNFIALTVGRRAVSSLSMCDLCDNALLI